jgi:hypothetical protein
MSTRPMIKRDTAPFIHTDTPAVMGDEVHRTTILQRRLTDEAIQCRNSVMATLFPSDLTKAVRTTEREIVLEQLQTKQETARYLNEAGLTMLRTALDQIVTCGVADSMADTSSRLLARRQSLEAELSATWRRFAESAVEEQAWAASMPPAFRKATEDKIAASLDGFCVMMDTMLRDFEELVHQKIGRR